MFTQIIQQQMPEPRPIPMSEPFTWSAVCEASLINRSPVDNGLQAEHIEYAPKHVHQVIANLLNEIAETGTYPKEHKHGLMIPIQKPGQQKRKVIYNDKTTFIINLLGKLHTMTRQHLWTDKINQNKLRFTGHILILPVGIPVKQDQATSFIKRISYEKIQ